MWSLFRKKTAIPSGLSGLRCDMHSHLIPGIDDGAPDMETSLRLIGGLADLGYKKLITTPHIIRDIYPNSPETILSGLDTVRAALKQAHIDIELHAAAEYLIDEYFINALDEGKPLLTLKDNWVLIELSFIAPSISLKDILFSMQMQGYQPVLAHPERYLYFGANKTLYDELKAAGCLFQLNLLSIRGYYGRESQRLASYLIKKKYVDLLGTDLHREEHLHQLSTPSSIQDVVGRLLDSGTIRNPGL